MHRPPHSAGIWLAVGLLMGPQAWAAPDPDQAALDAGDAAWCVQDRRTAATAWRTAARAEDAATAAMAEVRLIQVSGTWGLLAHGPRADRALARCPATDPRCDLARADYEIMLHRLGLAGDLGAALAWAERAAATHPDAAVARAVWAGAADARELPDETTDGLARALQSNRGRWPRGPGTWTIGLGAAGAPGAGVGVGLRFAHPDVLWRSWRLDIETSLSTRGNALGSVRLQTAGTVWLGTGARASRTLQDLWVDQGISQTLQVDSVEAWAAPGLEVGAISVWLGPLVARERTVDLATGGSPQDDRRGDGAWGGVSWVQAGPADPFGQRVGTAARLTARTSLPQWGLADHVRKEATGTLSYGTGLGRTFVTSRVGLELAEVDHAWHTPSAGGGVWLRSVPAGRFRDPVIASLTIEARRTLNTWVQVALFVEGADIDALHGDVGAGVRLSLPPRPLNVFRLDVAVGDAGWGVTGGIGQVF